MLTAGDSHYVALTEKEIAEVTRATIEHNAGRALVIAADRYYNSTQSAGVRRVHRADSDAAADLLMVMPPDWGGSSTPSTFAEHFQTVAEVMPVMVVTKIFISRGQKFGLVTLEIVRDKVPNVVAIKDDMCGEFAKKMALLVHGKWAVLSGGQKQNHLLTHPFGCDGYLSTFISIKPDLAHAYWSAVQKNDLVEMRRIIRDYDFPFFAYIMTLPGGFNAGIQAMLELKGIAKRWRRKPYRSLTDSELAILGEQMKQLGLLD